MSATAFNRWGVSLGVLVALACVAVLHAVALPAYLALAAVNDGVRRAMPFEDLRAILQAGSCYAHGVNVYAPSDCLGGGTFNYSPFMLRVFALLHLGPDATVTGGVVMAVLYALSLALLPPVRSRAEAAVRLAAALSPAVWFGIEQGNFDLLLFALTALALYLLPTRVRGASYGIILLGFLLKFYPVALLPLALRESRRFVLTLAGVSLAVAAWFYAGFHHDIATAAATIPSCMPFHATFGAVDLPAGLHAPWLQAVLAVLALGAALVSWQRVPDPPLELAAAALLLSFCFFAAQNVAYREVYLLLALPGLWGQKRLTALVLLLMWEAPIRDILPGHGFWLLREMLWWVLIWQFLRLGLAFVIPRLRHAI